MARRFDTFYPTRFEPPPGAEAAAPVDPADELIPEAPPHNPRLDARRWYRIHPSILATSSIFDYPAPPTRARITQATIEVATEDTTAETRITQATIEAALEATDADLEARITQATIEAAAEDQAHDLRVTQYWIEVLIPLFDCPTTQENLCPAIVAGPRTDGLPYTKTSPDPCSGSGDTGGPRTGQ